MKDELNVREVPLPVDVSQLRQDTHSYAVRPQVRGKYLFVDDKKLYVCGVTYGTFSPGEEGHQFPSAEMVERDFAAMRQNGVNAVRTYTPPPLWLLDCAQRHDLRVMVGLPWEQHITFLEKKRVRDIRQRMSTAIRGLKKHPAILMYAVGNEIPPPIVRWYGRKRIEAFIEQLADLIKKEDPEGLVTYVNFPTTEYLTLPFLDVMSFNVYLETRPILEAYLYRLQNMAGEKPLVMAEIGLDSQRNGLEKQAEILDWQIRSVFATGCAGSFIFAWTDEWYRGGCEIEDWDFGLTTRDRHPKPALAVIKKNYQNLPFPDVTVWPRVSVFVCSYNGARTIRRTLTALRDLNYSDYEVVVISDGSTDATEQIAREFQVRLVVTENRGLSTARNEALKDEAADIVAYIDDDAYPDPDWLKFIAHTFLTTDFVGVGGPNFLPLDSTFIDNCVGNAPGGATHVLIDDREAEHIPGCNMAFKKEALLAVGGFDPQFRAAGDDVDLCWRLQKMGWRIGYHPSAVVWHHRRNSIKTYWKQQFGYGKAEAMLEDKWPQKYNAVGHIPWQGRLYGRGQTVPLFEGQWRIYQGVWGSALFQTLYEPRQGLLASLPLLPEWYLLILLLAILSVAGLSWSPLLVVAPFFGVALIAPLVQAFLSAREAHFTFTRPSYFLKSRLYTVTAYLHLVQPLARLWGRVKFGLLPFKSGKIKRLTFPRSSIVSLWSEKWRSGEEWLSLIYAHLREQNVPIHLGGGYSDWDLEVRGGLLGATRLILTVEEHGAGKQLIRCRVIPNFKIRRTWIIGVFIVLAMLAGMDGAWFATMLLGGMAFMLVKQMLKKCIFSKEAIMTALQQLDGHPC